MVTPAIDGGIGGKSRKRPFRRSPAKPYDRPPSAARGGLRGLSAEAGDGDWISKLAGGASRLITDGASWIFSSFFHKRLAAPPAAPAAPEENHQSRQEVPQVACITPSELQDQGGFGGHEPTENPGTNYSDAVGISELEQLVKQKTFTRIEFDRLMELLHSRTVETVTLEPAVVIEKGKNENASAQENGTGKSKLHENFAAPADSLTNKAASPAELAKAYMGSRPSKVSPSTLSLRSQVFQEDTIMPSSAPYVSKPFNLSVAPRSAIRFSGTPELPENGYQTPKPRRRSAICRMSCSPYFKPHLTTDTKGWRPSGDDYTGLSSSQLTTRNLMYSGGRQVLKQGRSVLDSDFGSFGPIRRIRHKSYLMPPSKDGYSTQLNKDVIEGSSSVHKLSHLDKLKYSSTGVQDAHDEENKISYAKVTPIPPKSTETAMRILQQLDKLVPSPKEKSSELQVIAREESPTLTHNMLRGSFPRNMEGLDSLKSSNIQDSGSLDTDRDSQLLGLRNSLRNKQDVVEENGPLKPAGNKLTSEACSTVNAAIPSTDAKTFSSSSSSVLPPRQNPSFQMSTSEDLLVVDDDNYNTRDASGPLSAKMNKLESRMLRHGTAETAILAKSMPSPKSIPGSDSILFREAGRKASGRPSFAEKDTGVTFTVSSSPSTHCQPSPTSTMPAPSLDGLASQKERTVVPVFNFVSKAACTLAFSSTIGVSDSAGQNVRASDAAMETSIEGPTIVKGDEVQKTRFLSKSYGNAVYSDIPTTASAVFGFGASSTSSQNNGLLHLPFLTSPVSAASAITHSDIRVTSTLFTSTATTTSISSSSSSSVAPIFPKVNSFQFGSSTSMGNPVSVSHLVNKSDSTNLETKPAKSSTFSTSTLTIPYTSSSSFSASTTSALPSSDGSSCTLAISAAFPSMGNSSSSGIPSSTFSSTGSGIFGLSASAQPSTSTFSFASNSSPNSTTTSGALAGSVFGTRSTQSASGSSLFTQSSTSQFGSLSSSSFDGSPFGSTTGDFSFSGGSVSSSHGTNSSFEPSATISLFKTGSQPSTSSAFGFSFGSSISSPSTEISFGLSSSGPSSSTFGSSTGSVLSFTLSGSTTSSIASPARPVFGMPTPAIGFSPGSPGNNRMNVEDSMADDTNQSAVSMVSTFGQPANLPAATNSMFGSTVVSSGGSPVFQFVGHQNPSTQSSSPFQAGNLVPPGGGFSVGSGGGDKSGRKFIKVKRDKLRKK